MSAPGQTRAAIREARKMISDVQKMDGNEAETRRRVERLFESVMGYDALKHLSREHAVHGIGDTEYMDFAIKLTPGKVSIVVEVKRVNVDLAPKHLKQGVRYAIDLGCEWVLLTNGRQWELHHVEFGQPPETRLIKAWDLMQDEIKGLEESFTLIGLRSVRNNALDELWQTQSALTPESLLAEILSEQSLRDVKNRIRRKTGASVRPEDIVAAIRRVLNDHAGSVMDQMKISLPERKARRARTRSPTMSRGGEGITEDRQGESEDRAEP